MEQQCTWNRPCLPNRRKVLEHTSGDRLDLMHFYESVIRQAIYRWRSISVEPLFERIKSIFRIDPLPVRGYHKASAAVLLSVLLYQIMVYTITARLENPILNLSNI